MSRRHINGRVSFEPVKNNLLIIICSWYSSLKLIIVIPCEINKACNVYFKNGRRCDPDTVFGFTSRLLKGRLVSALFSYN